MSKGDLTERDRIKIGDLVTYRSIDSLLKEINYKTKITAGMGIVLQLEDEYAKVYWLYARQSFWIVADKLTIFKNLP
jgi:hypothetical protein